MSNFIAIDVETANSDYSSICQIGLVIYRDGIPIKSWSSLINPLSHFDQKNISIHGIDENDVSGKPTFKEVYELLFTLFKNKIIIHHGSFDKTAFSQSYNRLGLKPIECNWLDSTVVVRRTWAEFKYSGYGLSNLAKHFGIEFKHHDALEDARTAGEIVLKAINHSGLSIEQFLEKVKSKSQKPKKTLKREGNESGEFYGQTLVFSGALNHIGLSKVSAADKAQEMGFNVHDRITKKSTFLCVGMRDAKYLNTHEKSSKQLRAEAMIESGAKVNIISAENFLIMIKQFELGKL